MIDIHSHIIPGIDDGSRNMEMTLEMLRSAERDGTKKIIATPHYLLEYGELTINEIKVLVEEINSIVDKEGINIKIYSGQEVYFTENIVENYIKGNIGTLNDSRYMLIEFPMQKFDKNIFETLYELQIRDIVPIIAHPERYKPFIEKPSFINDFINEGYLFQMNSGSLEGLFGKRVKATAELLLYNDIYNFIGSDVHNSTNRTIGLSKAINLSNKINIKSEEQFIENANKLFENIDIEFRGQKLKDNKSIFHFFSYI